MKGNSMHGGSHNARLRGAFDDGRTEVVEIAAEPGTDPLVYTADHAPVGGLLPPGVVMLCWDRAPALATLTTEDARGVPSLSLRLDRPSAVALRDALVVALAG